MQVMGISADHYSVNKAFKEKYGFPYPLLSDSGKGLPTALGADGRWAIFVDAEGKVQNFWDKITDKAGFPEKVLSDLAGA
mmetsp:Transcript_101653/g.282947  ORF Transcript_101653/g.282947 Transcript_101653/m.282947 type:complete len:80 (-) Transcript_101653:358-597(-)